MQLFSPFCDLQHKGSSIQAVIKALLKLINILASIIYFLPFNITRENRTQQPQLPFLYKWYLSSCYKDMHDSAFKHELLKTLQSVNLIVETCIEFVQQLELIKKSITNNRTKKRTTCCGADKRVDSANDLRDFTRVWMWWQPETMKREKRRDNRYNRSDDFIAGITNVYVNVHGGCMWSSARMGYVVSWYGRVVVVRSKTFDEGSWRRSSRGDTARFLMRVSWDRSGSWMQLDDRSESLRGLVVAMLGQSVTAGGYVDWMLYSWGRSSRW